MCATRSRCRNPAILRVHDEGDEGLYSVYACGERDCINAGAAQVAGDGHQWAMTMLPGHDVIQGARPYTPRAR